MDRALADWVCKKTGARGVARAESVQSLWGGYGEILRVALRGASVESVIVKRVAPGAGGGRSHDRKLRSYAIERRWYRDYAQHCSQRCRVPDCLAAESVAGGYRFLLEDLDASGFDGRRRSVRGDELDRCLHWLVGFHATFLGQAPEGLWKTGTYWHLDTRPDELATIADAGLREAAVAIDAALGACRHPTLVHGDAKLENFCFGREGVAVVDFQYVGGGCAMKDLAYFLFTVDGWGGASGATAPHLDRYFELFRAELGAHRPDVDAATIDTVEDEWRRLYPFAVADFHRFLAGWSPTKQSLASYRSALREVDLS